MKEFCTYCGGALEGIWVSALGNKKAHPHCFEQHHPPEKVTKLEQLLLGTQDPVLAAQVVCTYVSPHIAQLILSEFNYQNYENWKFRCAAPEALRAVDEVSGEPI